MFKSGKNLLLLLLNAKILVWYAIRLILKFFYVLMAAHCAGMNQILGGHTPNGTQKLGGHNYHFTSNCYEYWVGTCPCAPLILWAWTYCVLIQRHLWMIHFVKLGPYKGKEVELHEMHAMRWTPKFCVPNRYFHKYKNSRQLNRYYTLQKLWGLPNQILCICVA